MQRFEDREIGRGAGRAGIGREVEQHDRPPCARRAAVRRSATSLATLSASASTRSGHGRHRALAAPGRQPMRAAVAALRAPWRPPKTIGLVAPSSSGIATIIVASTGPGHCAIGRPLVQRLELERMRGDIGHVERRPASSAAARRCRPGRRPGEKPVSDTSASTSARRSRRGRTRRSPGAHRARWRRPGSTARPLRLERRDHAVIVRRCRAAST